MLLTGICDYGGKRLCFTHTEKATEGVALLDAWGNAYATRTGFIRGKLLKPANAFFVVNYNCRFESLRNFYMFYPSRGA